MAQIKNMPISKLTKGDEVISGQDSYGKPIYRGTVKDVRVDELTRDYVVTFSSYGGDQEYYPAGSRLTVRR